MNALFNSAVKMCFFRLRRIGWSLFLAQIGSAPGILKLYNLQLAMQNISLLFSQFRQNKYLQYYKSMQNIKSIGSTHINISCLCAVVNRFGCTQVLP